MEECPSSSVDSPDHALVEPDGVFFDRFLIFNVETKQSFPSSTYAYDLMSFIYRPGDNRLYAGVEAWYVTTAG
jgi:hypothetical protein